MTYSPAVPQSLPAAAAAAAATAARRRHTRAARHVGTVGLLTVLLVVSVTAAVIIGPADIAARQVWQSIGAHLGLADQVLPATKDAIVWDLRLPRVLVAAFVGAALAVCGTVMQAVTRNPLADPYLLGLSSGASLGAVAVIVLSWTIALPIAAFAGALAALVLSILLAGAFGAMTPSRIILAGLAVSAIFAAFTSIIIFWSTTGDSFREILSWLLGSIAGAGWSSVGIVAGAFLLVGVPLMLSSNVLDAFHFGDSDALTLGVNVTRARWMLLGATALLTGAAVSVSGAIGFVGLIVPHAVRLVSGQRNRTLMPVAALVGALLLVWADTFARTAFDPRELPVGIVTALLGAPVFALLLARSRKLR